MTNINGAAYATILILAMFVEMIMGSLSATLPISQGRLRTIASMVIAVALAIAYKADLPAAMGLASSPYIGPIITGIIISRGSYSLISLYNRAHNRSANEPQRKDRVD